MSKPAARIGDMHTCPMVTPGVPPIPHVGGPITIGCPTVLIGNMPAACLGDMCTCVGPPDTIIMGSTGVFIGGKPAARMGDPTAHGGMITIGCPTVLIGEIGMPMPPKLITKITAGVPQLGLEVAVALLEGKALGALDKINATAANLSAYISKDMLVAGLQVGLEIASFALRNKEIGELGKIKEVGNLGNLASLGNNIVDVVTGEKPLKFDRETAKTICSFASLLPPPAGTIAAGVGAVLHAYDGEYVEAGLSLLSMIPVVGTAAGSAASIIKVSAGVGTAIQATSMAVNVWDKVEPFVFDE